MPDVLVFTVLVPTLLGTYVILDIHDPMPETYDSKFLSLTPLEVVRERLLWGKEKKKYITMPRELAGQSLREATC